MPVPTPQQGEERNDFISRCISTMKKQDPNRDDKQIQAICYDTWRKKRKSFKFISPITKAWKEPITEKGKQIGEHRLMEVTISGLKEDRDGEMMSQEAINHMIEQIKSQTIGFFPNHGEMLPSGERIYKWQDMMGVWVDAYQEGPHLKAVVRLNNSHPEADLFWKYAVEEKMPLAFSIGGKPLEEPKEIEIEQSEKVELEKARGEGIGAGGERQGDGGADICKCPKCGYTIKHEKGTPCQEISCPECGTKMVGTQKSVKGKITNFEEKRKQLGMSVEEFYAIPRDPPSSSKLPIFDEAHVRNAMARFNQVQGVSEEEKRKAYRKILARAKKYGIDTSGFEERYG